MTIHNVRIAGIEASLARYDEWVEERADLSARDSGRQAYAEQTGKSEDDWSAVHSSEWHDSDDAGVDYAHALAETTRELLASHLELWTLTVDDHNTIATMVEHSEKGCVATLRERYDSDGEYDSTPDDEIIQTLIDMNGLVIYIDSHDVPLTPPPDEPVETATCRHCDRPIARDRHGRWIDPDATGDDSMWRETCDKHDTATAEHEPAGTPTATYHGITKARCLTCDYTSTAVTELELWNDYGVVCIRCDVKAGSTEWTLVDGTVRTTTQNEDGELVIKDERP